MKTSRKFLPIILGACALFTIGCGKGGNSNSMQSQQEITNALVGTWVNKGDKCDSDDVFSFGEDGKYIAGDEKGIWSLEGDYLKVEVVVAPDEDTQSKTAADEWGVKISAIDNTNAILHRGDGTEITWNRCPAK